jgi:hypothetical protein
VYINFGRILFFEDTVKLPFDEGHLNILDGELTKFATKKQIVRQCKLFMQNLVFLIDTRVIVILDAHCSPTPEQ